MNSPKEIANRVLEIQERGKFEHLNFGDHQFKEAASIELARAYLELENKHEYIHNKLLDDIEYQKKEITKLKKSREVLRTAVDKILNGKFILDYGIIAREAIKADDEIMGNSFKIDSNIYKAPVDGWYSFSGGMFKLSANQPTELINGEYGIEPKEYLEKIAYKKED